MDLLHKFSKNFEMVFQLHEKVHFMDFMEIRLCYGSIDTNFGTDGQLTVKLRIPRFKKICPKFRRWYNVTDWQTWHDMTFTLGGVFLFCKETRNNVHKFIQRYWCCHYIIWGDIWNCTEGLNKNKVQLLSIQTVPSRYWNNIYTIRGSIAKHSIVTSDSIHIDCELIPYKATYSNAIL